jgi:hypothetical protein
MTSYEMLWDCAYCGTRKLLGKTHRFCPKCGAPQDPTGRYFPPEGEEVAAEGHVYVGADRTCESCGSAMSAAALHCSQCGADLTGARTVALIQDGAPAAVSTVAAATGPADAFVEEAAPADALATDAAPADVAELSEPPSAPPSRWLRRAALGCGGVVLLVVGFLLVAILWREDDTATVTRHDWERTIAVEALAPRSESAWCDSVPSGAYGVSRKREVRSHRQIKVGEDCTNRRVDQGDGTFRVQRDCSPRYREEDVYGDKCYFSVDRWGVSRTERAAGDSAAPRWPEVALARTGTCRGCERQGARTEAYRVSLRMSGGDTFECTFPEGRWRELGDGTRWGVEKSKVTGQAFCSTLKPAR